MDEYLGMAESAPAGQQAAETGSGNTGYRNYYLKMEDPEKIAALRPYLRFSQNHKRYYDAEYVYVGYAGINNGSSADSNPAILRCYLKLGKMPEDILSELKAGRKAEEETEMEDDSIYYEYQDSYYDSYYGTL